MNSYNKLRLSILFLLALMVSMIWDSYHRYEEYKTLLYYQLDNKLHDAAMMGAELLGEHFHDDVTTTNTMAISNDRKNEVLLNSIVKHSDIKYVYSVVDLNGKLQFASASSPKDDAKNGAATRFFESTKDIEPIVRNVLKNQQPEYRVYTDRWGSYRSVFIPMKSSSGNQYVMVADVDITDVAVMLDEAFIDYMVIPFTILFLLSGLGYYYIRQSEKITHQLKSSNNELDYLRKSLEAKIAEKTLDLEVKNHQLIRMNETLENRVDQEIEKNIEKDHQLIHQSRLAQLGEMVSMIAHQWRQPLAAIGSNVLDVKLKFSLEKFDLSTTERQEQCKNYIETSLQEIDDNIQMLTATIDDFRNFYKADKAVRSLTIHNPIDQAIKVMKSSFESNHILLTQDYRATRTIEMYDSELTQVFLNILKNAQDNFLERKIENPVVMISTYHTPNNGIGITFCDNGGGIDDEIIDKIFDPYFSTKSDLNGTGLGLYMSKTIIEEHHKGSLTVSKIPRGVCFKIELEGVRT